MTNDRYLPFGDILTNMEREGILVNRDYLAEVQIQAERDADASCERFLNWAVCFLGEGGKGRHGRGDRREREE